MRKKVLPGKCKILISSHHTFKQLTHHRVSEEEDIAMQVFKQLTHHRVSEEEDIAKQVEDSQFPPASYSHLGTLVLWS